MEFTTSSTAMAIMVGDVTPSTFIQHLLCCQAALKVSISTLLTHYIPGVVEFEVILSRIVPALVLSVWVYNQGVR